MPQPLDHRSDKSDEKECEPNDVQNHALKVAKKKATPNRSGKSLKSSVVQLNQGAVFGAGASALGATASVLVVVSDFAVSDFAVSGFAVSGFAGSDFTDSLLENFLASESFSLGAKLNLVCMPPNQPKVGKRPLLGVVAEALAGGVYKESSKLLITKCTPP